MNPSTAQLKIDIFHGEKKRSNRHFGNFSAVNEASLNESIQTKIMFTLCRVTFDIHTKLYEKQRTKRNTIAINSRNIFYILRNCTLQFRNLFRDFVRVNGNEWFVGIYFMRMQETIQWTLSDLFIWYAANQSNRLHLNRSNSFEWSHCDNFRIIYELHP